MNIKIETEADIVNYLLSHPDFFQRHLDVLATVKLLSPHGQRAVSLQERQAEMLRERIKQLEHQQTQMLRHASDNSALFEKILRWAGALLLSKKDEVFPEFLVSSLKSQFSVPQVALRIWGFSKLPASHPALISGSDELALFAQSLSEPFCGRNTGFDAAKCLDEPESVASIAFLPLRASYGETETFGLLVLASPDEERFSRQMSVDYLRYLAELAAKSLIKLR